MLDRHDLYRVGTGGMSVFEPENVQIFLNDCESCIYGLCRTIIQFATF